MTESSMTAEAANIADWLQDCILMGEDQAWTKLPSLTNEYPSSAVVRALTRLVDNKTDADGVAEASSELRRAAGAMSHAGDSVIVAAVSMLRLSSIGHDDPAWGEVLPRWLVPGISHIQRGLGLLALALHSRDRLRPDDYAEIMDEALSLIPNDSPLRHAHIYQYALYLGLRGMLQRLNGILDLPRPGDQEPDIPSSLLAECYYDAVCCARTAQAAFIGERLSANPAFAWQDGLISLHRSLIPVFDAIANGSPVPESNNVASLPLIKALLGSDPDLIDEFQADESGDEISPLFSFDGLRVALAKRDITTARKILERREFGPDHHWLDDFFHARLLLLEDRPREAGAAFERVEAAAIKYGGIERLEIELRLSTELSRHDCCRLGMLSGGKSQVAKPPVKGGDDSAIYFAGSSSAASGLRTQLASVIQASHLRILLCGPNDGSRKIIADWLHERMPLGKQLHFSAVCWNQTMADEVRAALKSPVTLFLDDLECLSPAGQASLLAMIHEKPTARLLAGCERTLPQLVSHGTWRSDLFWLLASQAVSIPQFNERASDLTAMANVAAEPSMDLRWETTAANMLANTPFPGGWSEYRAFLDRLLQASIGGVVTAESISKSLAEIRFFAATGAG